MKNRKKVVVKNFKQAEWGIIVVMITTISDILLLFLQRNGLKMTVGNEYVVYFTTYECNEITEENTFML